MMRSAFIVCTALVLASAVHAQERTARVGILDWQAPSGERIGPFSAALRELGYVEGQNVILEYRSAEGRSELASSLAAELVRIPVDVIVAFATPASHAAKFATSTIPIVMIAADPIGTGLVSNLARPAGNVTGISTMLPELAPKRLELLREALPGITRIAFLASTRDPAAELFVRGTQAAGERMGIRVQPVYVGGPAEFEAAFAMIEKGANQAVVIQPLFLEHSGTLAALSLQRRLPAVSDFKHSARAGLLMSYGPDVQWQRRTPAIYVDRILKGARPGDLPVEQPSQLELAVNMQTARALGLAIPEAILARADEVIE